MTITTSWRDHCELDGGEMEMQAPLTPLVGKFQAWDCAVTAWPVVLGRLLLVNCRSRACVCSPKYWNWS